MNEYEFKQEMEATRSETSSSLQRLRHDVEEEIKRHQGFATTSTERADMAVRLHDATELEHETNGVSLMTSFALAVFTDHTLNIFQFHCFHLLKNNI